MPVSRARRHRTALRVATYNILVGGTGRHELIRNVLSRIDADVIALQEVCDLDFLHEASPLTHVGQLRAPLFIIHGANDPRVPLSEAEQLYATLKDKGIRSELLVYPDEGHGLQKLANRLDAYPKALDFLDEVLTPPG